jgi:hypothetical protein
VIAPMAQQTINNILRLKLNGDPVIYFTHVKAFIENAVSEHLANVGVDVSFYKTLSSAFESNQEKISVRFFEKSNLVINLLKIFEHFDRPLDWYNGEEHDFVKLVQENEFAIDSVLEILKTEIKS